MAKTVKVTYNADTLQTTITVDGQPFDTSRINGKEIEDWAYPFMMRKVKWNGFYDEMVEALGGDKEFNLLFEGSEEALAELKEAWEDAPVTIISEEESGNIVVIEYDENTLTTNITVNGQPFDTSRINGREIEDWIYPFMMRKVKWDGIFEELAKVVGSEEYAIQFYGSKDAMKLLMEECPENAGITVQKTSNQSESYGEDELLEALNFVEAMTSDNDSGEEYTEEEIEQYFNVLHYYSEKGNLEASCGFALLAIAAEEYETALNLLKDTAQNGYAKAQYLLGSLHHDGLVDVLDQNLDFAVEWYRKAAEQGYALAQDDLGDCYYYGDGVEEDYVEAVKWYQRAAEQGNKWSQDSLGECYYNGNGVDKDYNKAFEWYLKAAEQGCARSQNMLGLYYQGNYGVKRDYAEAFKWFMYAAEQEFPEAQATVGYFYERGYVESSNMTKAIEWYTRAAENGVLSAKKRLAELCPQSKGIQTRQSTSSNVDKVTNALNKTVGFFESETGQNVIKVGKVVGQIGMALFQANQNRKASYGSSYSSDDYYDDEY